MHFTNPELEDRIRTLSSVMKAVPADVQPHLTPLDDIRAVLFDVYGTLFISASGDISVAGEQHDSAALSAALKEIRCTGDLEAAGKTGLELFEATIQEMHRQRRTDGIQSPEVDILEVWRDVLEELCDRDLVKVDVTEPNVEILAVEFECRVNPVYPMPGSAGVLEQLRKSNLPLGIVSNAQFYTPLLFPALLGMPLNQLGFDPQLCSFSYKLLEAKPSMRIFEPALDVLHEQFSIEPGEVVYIGNDFLNDVYTASLAGCRTILFAGDRRSLRLRDDDSRCIDLSPDAVITDLGQIPGLLLA